MPLPHFNTNRPAMFVTAVTSHTDPCKLFAGSDSLVPVCLSCVNLTVWTNTACLLSVILLLSAWSYRGEVVFRAPAVEPHKTYLFSVALSERYSVHSLFVCKVKEGRTKGSQWHVTHQSNLNSRFPAAHLLIGSGWNNAANFEIAFKHM